jgi:hypothetical protein
VDNKREAAGGNERGNELKGKNGKKKLKRSKGESRNKEKYRDKAVNND